MLTRRQRRERDEAALYAAQPSLVNLSDDLILLCASQLLDRRTHGEEAEWRNAVAVERLGQCTKNLRRVCSDGSLWTHVTFPLRGAMGLTDIMPAKLLTRVQARTHMVSLRLTNCFRLDCSGLEPLRGSAVLRTVDLRRQLFGDYRPLANGARTLLRDLMPQLQSLLMTTHDTFSLTDSLLHPRPPVVCFMCRELVPGAMPSDYIETFNCHSCNRTHCSHCADTSWRRCDDCGDGTCYFCRATDEYDDDDDGEGCLCQECHVERHGEMYDSDEGG